MALHIITIMLVVRICKLYYGDDRKAQMIGFILCANSQDKFLHTMAFNDSFMMVYMLICIKLILQNKPLMSSVMLSVALSIKAGVILMLPGFLGQL